MDEPLALIELSPSTCRVKELVYLDANGVVKSREQVSESLSKEFELAAGKAVYLGDFAATSTLQFSYPDDINYRWEMREVKDNYNVTTKQLHKSFPAFSALPTENKMLGR